MQVTVESNGALEKTLRVQVPEEKIAGEVENRLKSLSKTTRIQGFRPGKVPIKLIKQRFGAKVRDEVIGEIIQSSFYEAITQEKLRPAGTPEIGPLDTEQGQGIAYTAKFEVIPELELSAFEELEIDQASCEITEEDINRMIEVLREQRKTLQEVEREAGAEDTIDIDFKGRIDGELFEGGESTGLKLELNSKRFIDGFEEGLIGKKAGEEIVLDLKFPENYHNKELAGKPVQFDVTVNSVHEAVLAELDEPFFTEFGVKEGGLEAFRVQIREHMQRESEQALKRRFRDAVMDAVHEANDVELPVTLVDQEKHRMKHQFEDNLKAQGISLDDLNTGDDDSMFDSQARKQVALQLIIADLINKEGIKADPAKVRSIIEKNAENYEDSSAIVNWYYSDKSRLAEIEAMALEEEVVDWVVQKATIKPVNLTFDECMNKGQTESN